MLHRVVKLTLVSSLQIQVAIIITVFRICNLVTKLFGERKENTTSGSEVLVEFGSSPPPILLCLIFGGGHEIQPPTYPGTHTSPPALCARSPRFIMMRPRASLGVCNNHHHPTFRSGSHLSSSLLIILSLLPIENSTSGRQIPPQFSRILARLRL